MAIMNITDMPKRQDAFCVSCKAEVMVLPDLACPRCGDQVAPESLARMPGTPERPTVLLALGPAHPDYVPPAESGDSKPWSQKYPACLDCGTTTRLYMAMGRCRGCYGPWIKAGRPS